MCVCVCVCVRACVCVCVCACDQCFPAHVFVFTLQLPAESLAPSKNVPLGCIREINMCKYAVMFTKEEIDYRINLNACLCCSK